MGVLWVLLRFRREGFSDRWFAQATALVIVLYLVIAQVLLPGFNAMKTPGALIPEVQKRLPEGQPLFLFQINAEIMPLYCERPGEVYWGRRELSDAVRRQRSGMVVFRASVFEQSDVDYGQFGETGTFSMGNGRYVWLAYCLDGD